MMDHDDDLFLQLHPNSARLYSVFNASSSPTQFLPLNFSAQRNSTDSPDTVSGDYRSSIIRFQFYAWGVVGTLIAALGLVGNMLSIRVLCHRRMRSSTSLYLTSLAIYDSIVLLSLVMSMSLPIIYEQTGYLESYAALFPYIQPVAYPIALISQTCSIYTTVGFTVERYIAVCLPLRVAKMCTLNRARKSIVVILVSSVVYNIPRMLEYHTVQYQQDDAGSNLTSSSSGAVYVKTALGQNLAYRYVYFVGLHLLVMLAAPFTVLMVLNILLIRAIRRSARTKGRITNKQRRENNLTTMLLSVVVVFLICQVPSIVDNVSFVVLRQDTLNTLPFIVLTCVASLMVITNSAVNFVLYCVFGQKFRRVFARLFCLCCPRNISRHFLEDSLTRGVSQRDTSPARSYHGSTMRKVNGVDHKSMHLENGTRETQYGGRTTHVYQPAQTHL